MDTDIVIVGGGLCGLSLALALRNCPLRITLIESKGFEQLASLNRDGRSLVLTYGSSQILQDLGVWSSLLADATPIEQINISKRGSFLKASLSARQARLAALGYVIPLPRLLQQLYAEAKSLPNVQFCDHTQVEKINFNHDGCQLSLKSDRFTHLNAKLCIAADGTYSFVRNQAGISASIKDYQQIACVSKVHIEKPHQSIAIERFTDTGPLALLPLTEQRMAVVWMHHPSTIDQTLALSDQNFIKKLHDYFGFGFGRFSQPESRSQYSLKLTQAKTIIGERLVLVGNAANTLHPVAGQGFNLGLRDVAVLANLLTEQPLACGEQDLLLRYQQQRSDDHARTIRFTDTLATWFVSQKKQHIIGRNLALLNATLGTPFKQLLFQQAMRTQ